MSLLIFEYLSFIGLFRYKDGRLGDKLFDANFFISHPLSPERALLHNTIRNQHHFDVVHLL